MPIPVVQFTDERLENGLRLITAEDHLAPVVAVNVWYDVGSKHEEPGKTGFAHLFEHVLWLEADRMGTLLDALSQENLDNQRAVVKNERRWSYDNRPYGTWNEKLQAHLFPPEHPYHHSTIGSMEDLDAASIEDVSDFFRTYYAPNNAVLSVVGD